MLDGASVTVLLIYVTLLVIALIALTLFVLLVYSGLFRSVEDVGTCKPPIGQVVIAYKFLKGSYGTSGQIFTEAAIIAPSNKALGIYYDDPDMVDSSETRYVVGSILSEDSSPINEDMVKQFTDKDYKVTTLPKIAYAVQTSFPHITTLSILFAVSKAYPRLKSYIKEQKLCAYPFIEVYDGKTIYFMAPLYKQEEFYVPECCRIPEGEKSSSDEDFSTSSLSLSESTGPQDLSLAHDFEEIGDVHSDVKHSLSLPVYHDGKDANSTPCIEVQYPSSPQSNETKVSIQVHQDNKDIGQGQEGNDTSLTQGHEGHGTSLTQGHEGHDTSLTQGHEPQDESSPKVNDRQELSSANDNLMPIERSCSPSLESQILYPASGHGDSLLGDQHGDVIEPSTRTAELDGANENNANNSCLEANTDKPNEDEQVSDDSSSSFEVLKEDFLE